MVLSKLKIFSLLFLLAACASGGKKERQALREFVKTKNFREAHKVIESSDFYQNKDSELLFLVEKGLLHHLQGHFFQSIQFFAKAKSLSQLLYTKSFSGKAKSLVFNDNYDKYYGEVYERSMIHFYLSLNHFLLAQVGEIESRAEGKKILAAKKLSNNERVNQLSKARSEVLAWDSFLESIRSERRGRSVFKYDLMAKIYGGFVHEATGTASDGQIALQLYKDAMNILFRNYNSYKTFNQNSVKFKKDFALLPSLKAQDVEKKYVTKTLFYKQLKNLLDYKILSLTQKIRPRDFKKMIKLYKPTKGILKRVKNEKWANISLLFQDGMISEKIAEKQYFGLKKAMQSKSGGTRFLGQVGHLALTAFAANKLGLLPAPGNYHPVGSFVGIQTTALAAQELAIEFELPKIKNKMNDTFYVLNISNESGKEIKKINLALVDPLGDIGEEAVAETSAWRYGRLGTRLALKHLTAIAASYGTYKATEKSMGAFFAKSAALVQYIGASKAIAASERADTRYWSTLPQNLRMSQFYLPKGSYSLKVEGFVLRAEKMVPTKSFNLGQLIIEDVRTRKLVNYRSL